MIAVQRVGAQDAAKLVSALADLLIDAVEGGASVNFLTPLERTEAEEFWRRVALGVERSDRVLLAAFEGTPRNQQHRAEVAKVLVLQRARRRGIARRLLSALEEEARGRGRTLLTLDTMVGSAAERLYASLGYVRVRAIPDYALWPNGTPGPASIFYKQLV